MRVNIKDKQREAFIPLAVTFVIETREEAREMFEMLGQTRGGLLCRLYSMYGEALKSRGYVDSDNSFRPGKERG